MRHIINAIFFALAIVACGNPQEIIFGPEPLKQISEQGDRFKHLSEEDRVLLVGYLTATEIGKTLGADVKPATGRTVREVLADAHAWRDKIKAADAEAKKREKEAEALKAKVLADRKAIGERIASSVTVAVTEKKVLPKNYDAGRYSELLTLSYAIQNKSDKTIKQLKGRVTFRDATGDEIGWLPVDFNEPVKARKTLNTDTGQGWKLNEFRMGEIEKIAAREFSAMQATFEPESIAFEGGEVLKAPEPPE